MANLSEGSLLAKEREARERVEIERARLERTVAVPTNDLDVKKLLREQGEPICLFGEQAAHRRERLRKILAQKTMEGAPLALFRHIEQVAKEPVVKKNEVFFTEGSENLKRTRLWLCQYSLPRAKKRIAAEREQAASGKPDFSEEQLNDLYGKLKTYTSTASQTSDSRPLTCVSISPDAKHLVSGSFSGLCQLWSLPDGGNVADLKGHSGRATDVAFNPQSERGLAASGANIATASMDCTVRLWSVDTHATVYTLGGHADRLCRVGFHPSGRLLGSCSFDKTWRLWDLETQECLSVQEGHSRPCYCIGFQGDGSIVATGGVDAYIWLWDLRTGRSILQLKGHVKQVLGLDFHRNGYELVSCSDDHSVRFWDLRKKDTTYTLPAHLGLISDVKYEREYCRYIATSSYDKTAKIWSTKDHTLLRQLVGHNDKVASLDVAPEFIVTASFDRTWKLWTADELAAL
eukprot:TRINITY_DN6967_c0_g1_i1.p1 TRINITY_DN6967_c0_g1~~TRINITY_DN6967_c0_g1_i1.p1  ORF type:complete len:479 (-),score=81.98 TRINITY_DN6967_c0_g1_i1:290-1672(-)